MSRADRFTGCMLGLAVGDSLGYPIEGWTGEQIRERYGRVRDFVESPTDPPERWRLPGLHSDDTQQALVVADTLIENGAIDPDAMCQKFLDMAEGPPHLSLGAHRGAGRNFRYTLQVLRDGAAWSQASRHTAGVGASMRVAPVGLALGIDDAALRTNTAVQALITHNDPRAVAAAFMVAHAIGRLTWIPPSPFVPEAFLQESIQFVRRSEEWLIEAHGRRLARECRSTLHHMSAALQGISGQIDHSPDQVLPGIATRASELAGYTIEHPCRGFAPAGVVSALYFFLHYRGEFEPAVEEAVNWGGDADTVGAILGALCGAHHGIAAIPTRWSDRLHGRDLVLSRARALAGDRSARESMPDLAEIELQWTLEEDRIRRERTGQPPVESDGWVRRVVVRQIPPRDDFEEGERGGSFRRHDGPHEDGGRRGHSDRHHGDREPRRGDGYDRPSSPYSDGGSSPGGQPRDRGRRRRGGRGSPRS
jgi:ADP-ribosyl-[dinitrogen reductase] hydrolase